MVLPLLVSFLLSGWYLVCYAVINELSSFHSACFKLGEIKGVTTGAFALFISFLLPIGLKTTYSHTYVVSNASLL